MNSESSYLVERQKQCQYKLYLAALSAYCGSVAMGVVLGYSSPALPSLQSEHSSLHLDSNDGTWFGSLVAIGALVGGGIAGSLTEAFGRKATLFYSCFPFIVGWLCIAYSSVIPLLFFGRFLTGVCVGIMSLTVPIYITEISSPDARGFLGACVQLCITIGVLLVYIAGMYLPWTWLAIFSSVFPCFLLISIIFMPETPQWLIAHNKQLDAFHSLVFFRGDEASTRAEFNMIEENILTKPSGRISLKELFHPHIFKPLLLSLGLMFFQQFSGINNIILYTVKIFKESNSSLSPNLSTIVVGSILVFSTVIASFLIDRAGRRILLLISGAVMCLSMASLGLIYFITEKNEHLKHVYGWIPLCSVIIFTVAFSLGYGPIPWLMMGELLPSRARGVASGIAIIFNWTVVFVGTKEFDDMNETFHYYGTYWLFSCVCLLGCFFVGFFLPETKGLSLEMIEQYFLRSSTIN